MATQSDTGLECYRLLKFLYKRTCNVVELEPNSSRSDVYKLFEQFGITRITIGNKMIRRYEEEWKHLVCKHRYIPVPSGNYKFYLQSEDTERDYENRKAVSSIRIVIHSDVVLPEYLGHVCRRIEIVNHIDNQRYTVDASLNPRIEILEAHNCTLMIRGSVETLQSSNCSFC